MKKYSGQNWVHDLGKKVFWVVFGARKIHPTNPTHPNIIIYIGYYFLIDIALLR